MFKGNDSQDDEKVFLTERHCFSDLLEGVTSPCICGMTRKAWMVESLVQVWRILLLH